MPPPPISRHSGGAPCPELVVVAVDIGSVRFGASRTLYHHALCGNHAWKKPAFQPPPPAPGASSLSETREVPMSEVCYSEIAGTGGCMGVLVP